ncbi:hypothetical protein JCM17204_11820 [Blautia stercoris]|jgi:hypothetical protein|nr:hypothetical protein [Blautia stercoris]
MGEKSVNPAETVVAKENKKAYNRPVIDKMRHQRTDGEREVLNVLHKKSSR